MHTHRRSVRTRPAHLRAGTLCIALALTAVACGADGSDDDAGGTTTTEATSSTETTSTTEASETTTTVDEGGDESCDIPPAPTGDDALSVNEPFEDDVYGSGSLTAKIVYPSGSVRCDELPLDGDAGQGWVVDTNEIELVFSDGETTLTLTTTGEPMAGLVDAELEVDGPRGTDTLTLDEFGVCSMILAQMDEGSVEGWINCPDGSTTVRGVQGHYTATT